MRFAPVVGACALSLTMTLLSACNLLAHKPGQPCQTEGAASCASKSSQLLCASGVWTPVACKGPGGCTSDSSVVTCDDNLGEVGDGCRMPSDASQKNWACSVDKSTQLVCAAGKFTLHSMCRGPGACSVKGETIDCDNSLASADDACDEEGDFACSTDHKLELKCKGGKFAATDACRGPKGCQVGKEKVDCDDTLAMLGDPCGASEADVRTCSVDGKEELLCRRSRWERGRSCARRGCAFKGDRLECE